MVRSIDELKSDMAEMFGMTVEELGDPFLPGRKLPEPKKYLCQEHGWWYPSDNIECPGCTAKGE